mmetsp:Transcript_1064/g.1507  ORF Transcript_1064/g.1507 Transcript_1064/m.1507 type:complete len:349 (+) Transcript_1064:1-1047(+)
MPHTGTKGHVDIVIKPETTQYSEMDVAMSVVMFMAASAGMSIANKMAVDALGMPLLLVGLQCAFTAVIVPVVAYKTVNLGSWSDKLRWLPVSLLFVGMLATSMVALHHCSLGTAVVIRMLSPVLSVIVESFFSNSKFVVTRYTILALAVIISGVVSYGVFQKGIHAETIGIVFMFANMFVGTSERLAQRFLMVESPVNMSDTGFMIYNNAVCALTMPIMMVAFGEFDMNIAGTFASVAPSGWAFVFWSCLCGLSISYVGFRAQRRISATSFLIIVNLNKILVVAFGIVVLGEVYNPLAAIGAFLALLGGGIYTWDRKTVKVRTAARAIETTKKVEDDEEEALLGESEE